MDPSTARFIGFAAFSAIALAAGYALRRRGVLHEDASRPVHLHTLLWLWSPITVFAFWRIELSPQLIVIMLLQPLLMAFGWGCAALAARLLRLPPRQAGVLVLASALTNQGFTLGGYLCYTLLDPPIEAMSYAIAFVTSMQVFMVLIFYPVARYYELHMRRPPPGVAGGGDAAPAAEKLPPLPKLVAGSFLDVRAMPLFGAIVGVCINAAGAEFPPAVKDYHLLDIAFFVGAAGSYLGIGLRLRLGDVRRCLPQHAALVAIKFLAMPALAFGLIAALRLTPWALSPMPIDVVLICSACPSAINAVIISNLFHLDARLASILWLANTTLFVLLVLPVIVAVF